MHCKIFSSKWFAASTDESLIQPMNQGVIESMKKTYRKVSLLELFLLKLTDNTNIDNFKKNEIY